MSLAGPTTLNALLNALQMGFQSVAIERRSSEIWQVLGAVRTEFGKYNSVVERLSKQLGRKLGRGAQRAHTRHDPNAARRRDLAGADPSLLTERFVALAWQILEAENDDSTLLSTDWDNHGDWLRTGGFTTETQSLHVQIDRPSERRRARAGKRLRKLLKILLRGAQRHLASKAWDVEWAQESLTKDIRRQSTLLPWARVRWLHTKPTGLLFN